MCHVIGAHLDVQFKLSLHVKTGLRIDVNLPSMNTQLTRGLLIAPSENFLIFLLLQNYLSRKLVFILCLIWRLLVFIIWFRDTQCYFFFIENYLSQKLVFTEYLIHKYTTKTNACKSYFHKKNYNFFLGSANNKKYGAKYNPIPMAFEPFGNCK